MAFKWKSQRLEMERWLMLEERLLQDTRGNDFLIAIIHQRDALPEFSVFLALTHRYPVRDVPVLIAGVEGNIL